MATSPTASGGTNAEQPASERCVVLGPGEGRVLSLRPGDDVVLKAVSGETGGVFSFGEYSAAPASAGPPLHVHERADEAAYVLEGEFTIGVGDRTITAAAGSFVFVPRGVPHSVSNQGSVPARLVYLYIPAGIEEYWEEMVAVRTASGGRLDPAVLREIGAKHGHTLRVSSER